MIKSKTKEALILAGMEEINEHGLNNFSVRRIASVCGFSCATPYKHFRNKDDFIFSILRYINNLWYEIQKEILIKYPGDTKKRIVEISVAYVRFLVDNPNIRAIIMQSDESLNAEQIRERANISECTKELLDVYCSSVNMSDADRYRKTFIVRSLIYGAALMIGNGQLERSDATYNMVKQTIEREFEIS
ncbi:MAG: TetR/AcrR family transcriptional regulator [Clostridia bacterium]|nr:TetR/AcrR family transcriptional regulator [Clostridia bacterium]MDY3785317.1 TetR/AcrR family transcriptional regulator [Eubacteriales bacterium]